MIAHEDTIIAQCTPAGSGALALIRISGPGAVAVAAQISKLASGKNLAKLPTHTIHYGTVVDDQDKVIDKVLFFLMRAPRTFTGEDVIEISAHNNPFLIDAIIQRAISVGARLAKQGEFSQRAFMNGKVDLVQAEAINELIHASNQLALKQSLSQLDGSFSAWIVGVEKELVTYLALSDASFEFIDEENLEFGKQIEAQISSLVERIETIQQTFNQQQQIRQGIRIALVGSVNAGKSSLFNALIGTNRAIVTNIAGTTRDVIEAGLYKDGNYLTLIDTAGLRQTDDSIEKEGIKRSFEQAQSADIILLIFDQSRAMTQQEQNVYQELYVTYKEKVIAIANKSDLSHIPQLVFDSTHQVSSRLPESVAMLHRSIHKKIQQLFAEITSPFLLNKRHHSLLLCLQTELRAIQQLLISSCVDYELVSYHLKIALEHLSELTGKTISEQGMDAVFREFCVGK